MNLLFLLRPKDEITYISSSATVRQGLEKMRVHGYTAIPAVSAEGEYAGTVSEGDFLWAMCSSGYLQSSTKKDKLLAEKCSISLAK